MAVTCDSRLPCRHGFERSHGLSPTHGLIVRPHVRLGFTPKRAAPFLATLSRLGLQLALVVHAHHRFAAWHIVRPWSRAVRGLVMDDPITSAADVFESRRLAIAALDSLPLALSRNVSAGLDLCRPSPGTIDPDADTPLPE